MFAVDEEEVREEEEEEEDSSMPLYFPLSLKDLTDWSALLKEIANVPCRQFKRKAILFLDVYVVVTQLDLSAPSFQLPSSQLQLKSPSQFPISLTHTC